MLMIDRGEGVVIGLMGIRDESGIPNALRHRARAVPMTWRSCRWPSAP